MIITIDGPSGTGKSTVAKGVAKRLGFTFFDTGAMYRSFAWIVLKEGIDPSNEAQVESLLSNFHYEIQTGKEGEKRYFVNGTDVTDSIRSQAISMAASQIAIYPAVRAALVKIQRKFGLAVDAVFEGRDMGTVVFPEADLKIFLTAKPQVRAERRHRELLQKFPDLQMSQEEILSGIEERDKIDSNRAASPLKQASDAILIDTSNLTAHQVIDKIIRLRPKRRFPKMKLSYKIAYSLARFFFKTCFRLKVYGLEHFRSGPAIIAANHASFYDPQVLGIACPEEVHFLARGSLFDVPLLGRLIRILNSHPIARGVSDAQTLKIMVDLLLEGKKLILFPEGTRSPNGEIRPLARGVAYLMQKAHCPIIPAYISGTYEAWPRSRKVPKLTGKMAVVFGSPIEWEEKPETKAVQEEIAAQTEASLHNLKAWLDAGAHGIPP